MFKDREAKETKSRTTQFITFGVKLLQIVEIEVKHSKKSNRIQHVFHMETKPVGKTFDGFQRDNGVKAEGLIGRVQLGYYFDPSADADDWDKEQKEKFLDNITLMAEKTEVREELNNIRTEDWEEMIAQCNELLKGKYLWCVISGKEYEEGKYTYSFGEGIISKNDNNEYIKGIIVKHENFVTDAKNLVKNESGNVIAASGINIVGANSEKKDKITFDPKYHLKPFEPSDSETNLDLNKPEDTSDDLPF